MHKQSNGTLFLLRSYGDFVVALSAFSSSRESNFIRLIASSHLQSLYDELVEAGLIQNISFLSFEDFSIRRGIMSCFTNKHFLSLHTWKEIKLVRHSIKQIEKNGDKVYLEQSARLPLIRFFTGAKIQFVHDGKANVYDSYAAFGNKLPSPQKKTVFAEKPMQVLITPGSRKTNKMLPAELVSEMVQYLSGKGHKVTVAGLPAEMSVYDVERREYRSFKELIHLISNADFVITADSLPAHLAQLAGKLHWILYNNEINHPWLTPAARDNSRYASFAEWEKLKEDI